MKLQTINHTSNAISWYTWQIQVYETEGFEAIRPWVGLFVLYHIDFGF